MRDISLLATKMRIPPRPRRVMPRAHLTDTLEQEVPRHPLTVVAAPAGYGKTTLLAEWARSSRLDIAWLSLGAEDNDPERFLRYLLAAWQEVQPDVEESPLGLLLGSMSPDSEAVLSAFINAGNEAPNHVVFVLDDFHLIEDPPIHEALAFLLDHWPPALHLVLAGRAEPPLPLARYRARQQLFEIHTGGLRFSQAETRDFLSGLMGLNLSPDDLALLYAQTEGWIAGLQLAALTRRRGHDLAAPATSLSSTEASSEAEGGRPSVSGRQRFIADYLAQEVLDQLPLDTRDFLLKTSLLERLCGSLCEAVTGTEDGQAILALLERENLFLVPLDDSREWFRYHRLFADFLREELVQHHFDEVAGLHRRAARWFLAHDLPEQAFGHALDGDDVELVVQIFNRYLNAKLLGGELRVVKRWLDSLPAAWVAAYPVLDLGRAGFLAYTGAFEACIRCVDKVEQRLLSVENEDARWQMARVTAVRCFMACIRNDLPQAEALAGQALGDLPDADTGFRPGIYAALGDTYRKNGRWQEAQECYLKALDFTQAPTVRVQSAHLFGALADLDLRQGRLQDAATHWRKALVAIQEQKRAPSVPLPVIGWVYIRLGEILYEWNEMAEAWDHLSRGLEHAELGGDVRALIAGYLIAARLKLTEGDVEAAAGYVERAQPLVESAEFADWTSRFQRCQLELWLAQDRLRAAVNWSDEMLREAAIEERAESEVAQLAIARVLIVKGDRPALEQAQTLLERLLQPAQAEGRAGVTVEALALQALAHWRRGDSGGALTTLERALRLAEPEGYIRRFADLGLPMARLLQEARSRAVLPDYVETLLAAFGAGMALPVPAQEALPEPLTPREQEVLELLAAGLTNREIGEALVISPETVKKHTSNIYGKLGASNRTEAVARARKLDLPD